MSMSIKSSFLFFFFEVEFLYHKTKHFKVNDSVAFLVQDVDPPRLSSSKTFLSLKETLCPVGS